MCVATLARFARTSTGSPRQAKNGMLQKIVIPSTVSEQALPPLCRRRNSSRSTVPLPATKTVRGLRNCGGPTAVLFSLHRHLSRLLGRRRKRTPVCAPEASFREGEPTLPAPPTADWAPDLVPGWGPGWGPGLDLVPGEGCLDPLCPRRPAPPGRFRHHLRFRVSFFLLLCVGVEEEACSRWVCPIETDELVSLASYFSFFAYCFFLRL